MAHPPPATRSPPGRFSACASSALVFPETSEKLAWGHPTFRVRDKIFATIGVDEDGKKVTMTTKPPPGEQEALLAEGPPFFFPKYVGVRGWIGFAINSKTDWKLVAEVIEDSYRETAEAGRRSTRRALISVAIVAICNARRIQPVSALVL